MLLVHVAADLARKRRSRGVKLNYPEALAIILDYILEEARAGEQTLPELRDSCTRVVKSFEVMPGVAEMMNNVVIEATFPDGTKMVSVAEPIKPETVEDAFETVDADGLEPGGRRVRIPGEVDYGEHDVPINQKAKSDGRARTVRLRNCGDRPIQVGSHFHLFEANPGVNPGWPGMSTAESEAAGYSGGLVFVNPDGSDDNAEADDYPMAEGERAAALGHRPNIAAGTAIRIEPGDCMTVELVPLQGNRSVPGLRPEGTLAAGAWLTTTEEG